MQAHFRGRDRVRGELGRRVGRAARLRHRVPLGVDAEARAVLTVALPRDDEIAVRAGGDVGLALDPRRVGVDLELAVDRYAGRVVPLGEDALAGAVLAVAQPGEDQTSRAVVADGGE